MNILIDSNTVLPVVNYGGMERVIWYLTEALSKKGHNVTLITQNGSKCPFANVIIRDYSIPFSQQIPEYIDVVHFHTFVDKSINKPFVITVHGNSHNEHPKQNCIYVSQNHAERNNSNQFIHNGLNWNDYGNVNFSKKRDYYHFLGKAAWKVKNINGAIRIIKELQEEKLYVIGGNRVNLKMGFRCTLTPKAKFFGMVGGEKKLNLLGGSKGLVFPVIWDEPFGLAITESLYMGAPVFGTLRGSLPELVKEDVGFLSNNESEIANAIREANFSPKRCHEYAAELFNADIMADKYIEKYEKVLNNNNSLF